MLLNNVYLTILNYTNSGRKFQFPTSFLKIIFKIIILFKYSILSKFELQMGWQTKTNLN